MTGSSNRNVLVLQSGGPTPVFNRSLAGVVREAMDDVSTGEVYGAVGGIEGVLTANLIDLRRPSKTEWRRIARSPGAALGSGRRKLQDEDMPTLLAVLRDHGIGYMFIIGGNDSAETGRRVCASATHEGLDLRLIAVPKTIDNDLVLTDHTPGYGSAARFVALATMGAGRDAEAMGKEAPVTIIEVMGRDAGWLAAASALAKREARDAPHLVYTPETPLAEDRFVSGIEDALSQHGFAVAVIAENTRGDEGVIGGQTDPWYVDDFGHQYYDGPGRYLAGLVGRRLGVRTRYEKPGTIQRSMEACVSKSDAAEAEMAGRAAYLYAREGRSGGIVTLERRPGEPYSCTTGLAPLESVAGRVRVMPEEFLDRDGASVSDAFLSYATPLIGAPLPRWGRLR